MLDLGRTFLQSVDRSACTTALVDGALRFRWGDWALIIGGVQRGLMAMGLRKGDHVLSVLQNRNEAATLHWACQFAGLVMTPINWRAKPEEIDHALRDSGARLLVYEAVSQDAVSQSALAGTVPRLAVGKVDGDDACFDQVFTELVEPTPNARAEDLSLMLYTSGSAGRAGMNTRLRVIKLDSKNPIEVAGPMEEGQIVADLLSDEAFEGYHNREDANARSLRDGWYFTGDMGYVDTEGDLFVTGRVDDMIISGGENISPVDIESVLSLHPSVDEVAVAGLKDERWGQRVVAFVKARGTVAAESLDAHCRASDLVNFKRPREYVFVREIPKSPVGKVLRRKLVAGEFDSAPPPLPVIPPA